MNWYVSVLALCAGFALGVLPVATMQYTKRQALHSLVILAGCDAEINATEPLDVMAPKLAACIADQRKRLIEYETASEAAQNVNAAVTLPTYRVAKPKARAAQGESQYYRNLAREGVFPKTEHGEWP